MKNGGELFSLRADATAVVPLVADDRIRCYDEGFQNNALLESEFLMCAPHF